MLSNISFNDFYKEFNLKSIEDKRLFLLALLDSNKGFGTTQIHKLSFLSFAEGRLMIPFKFTKWPHGPFSEELRDELGSLEEEGLIDKNCEQVINYSKDTRAISIKGREFINLHKEDLEKIKKELKETLSNHDEGAKSLERYCYEKYFLKPDNKRNEEWDAFIKNKIKDILFILDVRTREVENFEEMEEQKRSLILTSFDYVSEILEKLFSSNGVDEVIKGVLVKNIEEYIDKWGEILRLAQKPSSIEEVKTKLFEIRKIFRFINESARTYGVFESIFETQNIEN